MNGLSLFSNVGIAETYLSEVGVDIVVANELLKERARFYSHIYPECEMIQGDITNSDIYRQIVETAKSKNVEFIIATPPCQGMSIAGEMNPYDERNSLVKYAVDAIVDLLPKYVLIENVVQMLETPIQYNGAEMLIPQYLLARLGNNYNFNNEQIINAMDYGVPQQRKRAIILLTRKDMTEVWHYPKPDDHIITLEEAFQGIPDLWPDIDEKEKIRCRNVAKWIDMTTFTQYFLT